MLRIGLLTSGGDCQALNATMRGIVKTIMNRSTEPVEIYGFEDGYRGLIYGKYRKMDAGEFNGILSRGGTILGTSRTPFKQLDEPMPDGTEKVPAMLKTYRDLALNCLFMLGGNGSTKTANRLREEGLNVIALPKTIDNDTFGTDLTFGFTSAVEVATKCVDDIKTTACSHGRVFVIEIMGHKVGWIPLYAAVAGGADVCLIPEIPYDAQCVVDAVEARLASGARSAIVVVAEGAISKADATLPKKEYSEGGRAHDALDRLRPGGRDRARHGARDPRVHSGAHAARRRARRPGPRVRHAVRRGGGARLFGGLVRFYGGAAQGQDVPRTVGEGRGQAQAGRPRGRSGARGPRAGHFVWRLLEGVRDGASPARGDPAADTAPGILATVGAS